MIDVVHVFLEVYACSSRMRVMLTPTVLIDTQVMEPICTDEQGSCSGTGRNLQDMHTHRCL